MINPVDLTSKVASIQHLVHAQVPIDLIERLLSIESYSGRRMALNEAILLRAKPEVEAVLTQLIP